MEQYYVNDEIFDFLQGFGLIKTKEDLIKEEKEKGKMKKEGKKAEEEDYYDNECPVEAMRDGIVSLVEATDNINKKLDILLGLITKNNK